MSPDEEQEWCDELTPELYDAILIVLRKIDVDAHVSYRIVEEIILHFRRDIERLYVTHHESIHPTKACSYLAFWIRKVKPVSDAYPKSAIQTLQDDAPPPHELEIPDINEQLAIHVAIRMLYNYLRDGDIFITCKHDRKIVLKIFQGTTWKYLSDEVEDEMGMGSRFQNLVYDMRFRTFGPHHLTHVLVHLFREVAHECRK